MDGNTAAAAPIAPYPNTLRRPNENEAMVNPPKVKFVTELRNKLVYLLVYMQEACHPLSD